MTTAFPAFPTSWLYLRKRGELPRRLAPVDPGGPRWYVLQNRPSAFSDVDRAPVARGRRTYVVTKLGVPRVWICPDAEYRHLAPRQE